MGSTQVCKTDWQRVIGAWMHDPVDKALSIVDHQARAKIYLSAALDDGEQNISGLDRLSKSADITASEADRIPMPSAGPNAEYAVNVTDGSLKIFHPVSAQPDEINIGSVSSEDVSDVIRNIVSGLPMDPQLRFLALWRLLPWNLHQRFGLDFTRLPADTRVPDHSLIQHIDITSGIAAADQFGHGYSILSVTLGPVQTFIQAARSVRDLWSGSAMLSWLIFQGIRPILRDLGPTAMIFPALRGNSLTDLWLRSIPELKPLIRKPSLQARQAPSLPNRFVALVPKGEDGTIGTAFADACQTAIQTAWKRLADKIRGQLHSRLSPIDSEWDRLWDSQIASFFEVTTSVCSVSDMDESLMASLIGGKQNFGEVWSNAQKVRNLHEDIPLAQRPKYSQNGAGRWQAQLEVSARIAEGKRSIRHVPQVTEVYPASPKCSLLGTYEQMGPANLQDSASFWRAAREDIGNELRERERFCAVALCKRFAPKEFLRHELDLPESGLKFPDTAMIAAEEWLRSTDIDVNKMNGRWLHQHRRDEDTDSVPPPDLWNKIRRAKQLHGIPPSYYAILQIDADDMGLWLKGEKAPYVRDTLHPKLRKYYEELNAEGLDAKRPVGPALHGAISEALNNFASFSAPSIVKNHHGTLIYSGGDDVLALLPVSNAVRCAISLQQAFCGQNGNVEGWSKYDENRHVLSMGNKATLSGGIAFVHFKEDLRGALREVREAEKTSKDRGKNRLTMKFLRRSGGRPCCDLPWKLAPWFQSTIETFHQGVSDRWIYQLRLEEPVLSNLPTEAVDAEIRRLIKRSEAANEGVLPSDAMPIDQWWSHVTQYSEDHTSPLNHFIDLCLGASFLSRGVDG